MKKDSPSAVFFIGGEGGIRTLDILMGYTRFPIVRARPNYATSPSGQESNLFQFSFVTIPNPIRKVKHDFAYGAVFLRMVRIFY